MDEELIIGARKGKAPQKQNLNIDRIYNIENFEEYILKFESKKIENHIQNVQLDQIQQRFNAWRIFLKVMPQDKDMMIQSLKENRIFYKKQEEKYIPVKKETKTNNPLQNNNPLQTNNPWSNFFEDNELRNMIKIDVERTYQVKLQYIQDLDFFQKQQIKNILQNVLFIWSKQNPSVSYKQGMNEVVAILTHVYFTECPQQDGNKSNNDIVYNQFMSEDDAEADIYALFNKIMNNGHSEMFVNNKVVPELFEKYKSKSIEDRNLSVILLRCKKVLEYVNILDQDLGVLFKVHKVESQIFLLRWIRCLCVREFHLQDSLQIWDSLFWDYFQDDVNNPFLFLDSICISMIVFLKQTLQQMNDQTRILQRLLKYPPIESLYPIINQAFNYKKKILKIDQDLKEIQDQKELQKQMNTQKNIILFNNSLEQEALIYQKDIQQYNNKKEKVVQFYDINQDNKTSQDKIIYEQDQNIEINDNKVKNDLNDNKIDNKNDNKNDLNQNIDKNVNKNVNKIKIDLNDDINDKKNEVNRNQIKKNVVVYNNNQQNPVIQLEKKLNIAVQKIQDLGQNDVLNDLKECQILVENIKRNKNSNLFQDEIENQNKKQIT